MRRDRYAGGLLPAGRQLPERRRISAAADRLRRHGRPLHMETQHAAQHSCRNGVLYGAGADRFQVMKRVFPPLFYR